MSAVASEFRKILNNSSSGTSSLLTPDFRFVEYSYPQQDLKGPHLPQAIGRGQVDSLAGDALAAFLRLR
jgi:hypothetical protein